MQSGGREASGYTNRGAGRFDFQQPGRGPRLRNLALITGKNRNLYCELTTEPDAEPLSWVALGPGIQVGAGFRRDLWEAFCLKQQPVGLLDPQLLSQPLQFRVGLLGARDQLVHGENPWRLFDRSRELPFCLRPLVQERIELA